MSLILCPECGTKISDKARVCPNCGYTTDDGLMPISVSGPKYEYIPMFQIDSEDNGVINSNFFSVEDNKNLYNAFGKFKNIKRMAPALADAIVKIVQGDSQFVVNIDPEIKKLIKNGTYKFMKTKDGRTLATLRDAKNIVKNLDITEIPNPANITSSLMNLGMYANMQEIVKEIENLHNEILNIHYELQNDRLALAEGAMDKLLLAVKIEDGRLRRIATLNAISTATDAKRSLMRNFSDTLKYILSNSNKNSIELMMNLKSQKNLPMKAMEAFKALLAITNSVQVECQGCASLGEYQASMESLNMFKQFIIENKLNDSNTLLLLNEHSNVENISLVDNFVEIAHKIELLDSSTLLEHQNANLLEGAL